jgi:hypothetical protein
MNLVSPLWQANSFNRAIHNLTVAGVVHHVRCMDMTWIRGMRMHGLVKGIHTRHVFIASVAMNLPRITRFDTTNRSISLYKTVRLGHEINIDTSQHLLGGKNSHGDVTVF